MQDDPDIGDLGYYAPGNDLVLYYGVTPEVIDLTIDPA